MGEFGFRWRRPIKFVGRELARRRPLVTVGCVGGLVTAMLMFLVAPFLTSLTIAPAAAAATPASAPLAVLFVVVLAELRLALRFPGQGFLTSRNVVFGFGKTLRFRGGRSFERDRLAVSCRVYFRGAAVLTITPAASAPAVPAPPPTAFAILALLDASAATCFALRLRRFVFKRFGLFEIVFFFERGRYRLRLLGECACGFDGMHHFAAFDEERLRRGH